MKFLAECFQGCQCFRGGNKRRGGFTPRHLTKSGNDWLASSRVARIIVFIPSLVQAQAKKPPSHPKQVAMRRRGRDMPIITQGWTAVTAVRVYLINSSWTSSKIFHHEHCTTSRATIKTHTLSSLKAIPRWHHHPSTTQKRDASGQGLFFANFPVPKEASTRFRIHLY